MSVPSFTSPRCWLWLELCPHERRERWLRKHGYTVLRLSDALVLKNIGVAVALIAEQVAALRR